ncbi:DUF2306 domain-containing protein [Aquimarina sp. 2201CG5-10]|uniref:DUF2306 domain-containing protein n=1 Tax=Aquimarina callyspongiae TaxID=3098150 RepID=UPI002AB577ED|nr:DUF2306 domain-containing protein [Aquimarina sp. 2201CG5-10]MDY8134028.1 DUF2306 domain-containing protein [Aquimarina sp. 2201CG5-10]
MKKVIRVIFIVLSILIGLYPFAYFFVDRKFGLLSSKNPELLTDILWNTAFYSHIVLGGIALMIGWSQFSKKIRRTRINLHKLLGKIYVLSVLISSISGVYIGFFATGGIIASLGFISLGIIWFYTTTMAYLHIKSGKIVRHQIMMFYSYAACFAAVTLRIWLPLLTIYFDDFIIAYKIVAWLCWIPNLIVAYFLIQRIKPGLSIDLSL